MHLGDFVALDVADCLSQLCRLEAVCGNCDTIDIRTKYPESKIIDICGCKIGLVHGKGSGRQTLHGVKELFSAEVRVALFGHTHETYNAWHDDVLFFNPGSFGTGRTFGILHVDGKPRAEVVTY